MPVRSGRAWPLGRRRTFPVQPLPPSWRAGLTRFPILTIFTNTHNDLLETPLDIDIADYGLEAIQSVMDDMEVFSTIRKLGVDPSQYLLNDEES